MRNKQIVTLSLAGTNTKINIFVFQNKKKRKKYKFLIKDKSRIIINKAIFINWVFQNAILSTSEREFTFISDETSRKMLPYEEAMGKLGFTSSHFPLEVHFIQLLNSIYIYNLFEYDSL